MKQVLQDLRSGATYVEEVPCPSVPDGHLLIRTVQTLVSVGTEKMLVDFGKANLLDKARQQPDKVRMVIDKIRTDGLMPTVDAVRAKLEQPIPMGYCNVGTVVKCGKGVNGYAVGDRVVSNGHHAEMVVVPTHLCARIPAGVSADRASFTVLGAIALQGIRLIKPELGETFTVIGLGLVGLLTVQLLKANGCRVIGVDFNPERASLARQMGAEAIVLREGMDPVGFAHAYTAGIGVDGVLITASTRSNDPVHQAANMCRKRGRIVLVGVVGLELSRADFYDKELTFQVSCSYGPGRYDPAYEQQGQDYPIGFVRWTEQRNFEAVLQAMASGQLQPETFITSRRKLHEAETAYSELSAADTLGVILECDASQSLPALTASTVNLASAQTNAHAIPLGTVRMAMIGAGNYAGRVLIPAFRKQGVQLQVIACQSGTSGVHLARKYGFQEITTVTPSVFSRSDVDLVAVATRHDSHARFVCEALQSGKHVFVEKPLAISHAELLAVEQAYSQSRQLPHPPQLMIGFNRRFSSLVTPVKQRLASSKEPACINMLVNAGNIPADSWIQDLRVGGGRIIGEVCHFVDLALFLAGSTIAEMSIQVLGNDDYPGITTDKCSIGLKFTNGSIANIQYWANGNAAFPKERIDVFHEGQVYQIDNFRKLRVFGGGMKSKSLLRQDKGNAACVAAFLTALRAGSPTPIAIDEIMQVSRCVIDLASRLEPSHAG